jgi:nickel-type superoxide dismutase maturation protease
MSPSLRPGDFLVVDLFAYRERTPSPGDVVLAPDPREPARTLVKRVKRAAPEEPMILSGDNPAASTDSRTFGPVDPDSVLGRVVFRYWPLSRAGPVG